MGEEDAPSPLDGSALAAYPLHAAGHSERHKLIGLGGREWRASAARIDTSGIANGHTTPPNGHHR